jgi:hypothetical protein
MRKQALLRDYEERFSKRCLILDEALFISDARARSSVDREL